LSVEPLADQRLEPLERLVVLRLELLHAHLA
jgi:hypothetical protein